MRQGDLLSMLDYVQYGTFVIKSSSAEKLLSRWFCIDLFIYYYAWWYSKQAFGKASPSITDISRALGIVIARNAPIPVCHNISWIPLNLYFIKINVDGSFNINQEQWH